jgi:hypothetical protein
MQRSRQAAGRLLLLQAYSCCCRRAAPASAGSPGRRRVCGTVRVCVGRRVAAWCARKSKRVVDVVRPEALHVAVSKVDKNANKIQPN